MIHPRRRLSLVGSSVLVLAALLSSALATSTSATVTTDTLGDELIRLTNLDRVALGRSALEVDPTLVSFAHGMAWTCPNTTMVLGGRSVDMARRQYFSHSVKRCVKSDGSLYSSLDVMRIRFHYDTTRGENIAWNRGYSTTTSATYGIGCPTGTKGVGPTSNCKGSTTTRTSVAVAQRGFMNSAGHRANILGSYDRYGCASGVASDGGVYYTCVFSRGGPAVAVTDAVLPRVSSETGRSGIFSRGVAHRFYATLSDNVGLRSGFVSLDGVRLKSWTFDGTIRSARVSVRVSGARMKYGYHTLVWHSRDTSGLVSTRLDGKVRFQAR